MIINDKRALAYVVTIDEIKPIDGYDRVEYARTNGWWVIIGKADNLHVGDKCVYFEVDSKVNSEDERFAFLEKRNYKIKTQRMCKVISQGLLMPISAFPELGDADVNTDVTDKLKVTYAVEEDNARKGKTDPNAKYRSMTARHQKIFKKKWARWMMRRSWGRKVMFFFFGKKNDNPKGWPVGKFPGVSKTDQERCENMPWILNDKTPFIVTQKCDGSSGTYILERKGFRRFEFYVCSRNVRMADEKQECFYGANNYYWEVAKKYDIRTKMEQWLNAHPDANWVCWQGEICAPAIQKNPHKLTETHFYCFHWTDSVNGRLDIVTANNLWRKFDMEVVPIVDTNFILPDDMETFKLQADGFYDADVCEGHKDCIREGFVYYKTTDPTFSFKNVSRKYLLKS